MNRFATALTELEGEHAALAVRLQALAAQLYPQPQWDGFAANLRDCLIELGMHFGHEESLMDGDAYPDFDHHRRQHMAMMVEMGLLLDRSGEAADVGDVSRSLGFFERWLLQHIAESDAALFDWMDSRA